MPASFRRFAASVLRRQPGLSPRNAVRCVLACRALTTRSDQFCRRLTVRDEYNPGVHPQGIGAASHARAGARGADISVHTRGSALGRFRCPVGNIENWSRISVPASRGFVSVSISVGNNAGSRMLNTSLSLSQNADLSGASGKDVIDMDPVPKQNAGFWISAVSLRKGASDQNRR